MRISYAVVAVALLFAACGPAPAKTKVNTEYDPGVQYSSYKTWAWATATGTATKSALDTVAEQAIASQLAAKGLTPAASRDAADLVVDCTTSQQHKTEIQDDGWGWGQDFGGPDPQPYDYGTMVVTLADPKTKTKIWESTAAMVVENKTFTVSDVDDAIAEMFSGFPPKLK